MPKKLYEQTRVYSIVFDRFDPVDGKGLARW